MASGDGDDPVEVEVAEVAAAMFDRDVASKALGIELVEVGEARSVVKMTVRPDMMNPLGVCHGGIIFTLADSAMAFSSNADNRYSLATHGEIDWIRPGREGSVLTATAVQRSHRGRTKITDVTVTDEHDEVIAEFRGRTRQVEGRHR